MKALPKRKGNSRVGRWEVKSIGLNESPNKKGKWVGYLSTRESFSGLNEILRLRCRTNGPAVVLEVVTTVCLLESPHNKVEKSAGYPSVLQPAELFSKSLR